MDLLCIIKFSGILNGFVSSFLLVFNFDSVQRAMSEEGIKEEKKKKKLLAG